MGKGDVKRHSIALVNRGHTVEPISIPSALQRDVGGAQQVPSLAGTTGNCRLLERCEERREATSRLRVLLVDGPTHMCMQVALVRLSGY